MSSLTFGAGFVITEPIKLGYHSYFACAQSLATFCDEVVVICGRREEESESLLRSIPNVRVINTDAWPIDYNHDHMYSHYQAIFDNATTDVVLKVDSDCIFQSLHNVTRDVIMSSIDDAAHAYVGRVNFHGKNVFSVNHNQDTFAINLKFLRDSGVGFHISNFKPIFTHKVLERRITAGKVYPINYDCTFMTRKQVIYKWRAWHKGLVKASGTEHRCLYMTDDEVLNDFVQYHCAKRKSSMMISNIKHPLFAQDLIATLTHEQWGFDNFETNVSEICS